MKRTMYLLIGILMVVIAGVVVATEKPSKNALDKIGPAVGSQFTYEPFSPPLKNHIWMDVGNGEIRFFHFDKPASDPDAKLLFIGEGVKGTFCSEDQPAWGETGFVHFHSLKAAPGEAIGHGGHEGGEGYWLRHIAVSEFDLMGKHFKPGIAMEFMPTPPPKC